MNIAICDDQPEALEELRELLKQLPFVKKVHAYSNMEVFFSAVKEEAHYDGVLMDIDWKNERTGIDFAEEMQILSPLTKIIYITAYTAEYVEDIFLKASNLSGFLMKPVKPEQLEKNLLKIKEQQKASGENLVITSKGDTIVIPFQSILYIENQLHRVHIVLPNKEYWCYERLELIKERLGEQFLSCHKSYVVNMEQIVEFRSSELQLTYGKIVPVSKARYREAKKRFIAYMSENL